MKTRIMRLDRILAVGLLAFSVAVPAYADTALKVTTLSVGKHPIRVEVKNVNYRVRARKGFVATP